MSAPHTELARPPIWDLDGDHEYLYDIRWNLDLPPLVVVGWNPGRDARYQDPTSPMGPYAARVAAIAQRERCGGFAMVNAWTVRQSDPNRAFAAPEKVGPRADAVLEAVLAEHRGVPILGAWGDAAATYDDLVGYRLRSIQSLAADLDRPIMCVGVNRSGQPRHLSSFRPFSIDAIVLIPWEPANADPVPRA